MARKIIDTIGRVTITPNVRGLATRDQAGRAAADLLDLIKTHIVPHAHDIRGVDRAGRYPLDFDLTFEDDARCEHCNGTWTEVSPDYNGGCCGRDEANSPERLAEIRKLAEEVEDGGFYPIDDGVRGRVAVNWPDTMASAISRWLDAGRPAEGIASLMPLARRVAASDWCTVWTDPGPSDASLARLPDSVTIDSRPDNLAGEVLSLIDDMGLLAAGEGATA